MRRAEKRDLPDIWALTTNGVLAERWNLNCESRSTPSSQRQTVKMAGLTGQS
jgi:hypothetical protein